MARLGVFGGTFDPPHLGHLILAEQARDQLGLDRVLWVPADDPPHKLGRAISPADHRLRMLELALTGNPAFNISTVDLERSGPDYTADTLDALAAANPGCELTFLIGGDSLRDLLSWHEPARIIERAVLGVMARPGAHHDLDALTAALPALPHRLRWVQSPQVDISGSDIRARVAEGRSIRYLVLPDVETYILQHGLYTRAREQA